MRRLLFMPFLLFCCSAMAADYQVEGPSWVFTTDSSFEDTKDNLLLAIESRGIVVSYIAHARDMLNRTAEALGVTTTAYQDAEIVMFCKSDLSHQMIAASPHNLTLCPYSISVYSLADSPELTYLAIRAPYEAEPATLPISKLLIEIIEETREGF